MNLFHVYSRLGHFVESNNLIIFGAYTVGLPTTSLRSASKYWCLGSVLSRNGLPHLSWDVLEVAQTSLEVQIILLVLRGLPDAASKFVELLLDMSVAQSQLTWRKTDDENQILAAHRCRADMLQAMVLLASSNSEGDRAKAHALVDAAQEAFCDPKAEAPPDATVTFCLALEAMAKGKFTECAYLNRAADLSFSDGQLDLFHATQLCKAWGLFLNGSIPAALRTVQQVLTFASSSWHVPLYIWALELSIAINIFGHDFDTVDMHHKMLRTLQGSHRQDANGGADRTERRYSQPSACALLALSFTTKHAYEQASPLASYACSKLAARKQGTCMSGIVLFCAIYAALDVVEKFLESNSDSDSYEPQAASIAAVAEVETIQERRSITEMNPLGRATSMKDSVRSKNPKSKRFKFSNRMAGSLHIAPSPVARNVSNVAATMARTSVRSSMRSSIRSVSARVISVSSVEGQRIQETKEMMKLFKVAQSGLEALKAHSLRYPCLLPLTTAITLRVMRLFGCKLSALSEVDASIKASQSNYRSYAFADAFMHLERTLLCRKFGVSTDFLRVQDSRRLAILSFTKLGVVPSVLIEPPSTRDEQINV